jgi:hypothetical protein
MDTIRIDRPEPLEPEVIELAPDEDALEFFDKVMRDPRQPMARRMVAAQRRADILYPKQQAVATVNLDGADFASALDRAIERSGKRVQHEERRAVLSPIPAYGQPRPAPWPTNRRS